MKSISKEISEIGAEEKIIEKEEQEILSDIRKEKIKPFVEQRRRMLEVKHYRFLDFCQSAIGVGIFGLSVLFTPDLWDIIGTLTLGWVFTAHIFFSICFFIALNYAFVDNVVWNKMYIRNLLKRTFFVYISVGMTIVFLLTVGQIITLGMTNEIALTRFFAGQSVGLMGAITFALFKK